MNCWRVIIRRPWVPEDLNLTAFDDNTLDGVAHHGAWPPNLI
jgi:hypothetical protein